MLPKIKEVVPLENFILKVSFDDNKEVLYDVKDDIAQISMYEPLKSQKGLFEQVKLDQSRTVVYWTDDIDLPSDAIYEYGKPV